MFEDWKPELQMVLHELLRHEGLGGASIDRCPHCRPGVKTIPTLRCKDCSSTVLMCRKCCVERHQGAPFHRIQVSLPFLSQRAVVLHAE